MMPDSGVLRSSSISCRSDWPSRVSVPTGASSFAQSTAWDCPDFCGGCPDLRSKNGTVPLHAAWLLGRLARHLGGSFSKVRTRLRFRSSSNL